MALAMASATSLIETSSSSPTAIFFFINQPFAATRYVTRENDGVNLVVVAQGPDEELGKVLREDELAQGLARAHDGEVLSLLCREGQVSMQIIHKTYAWQGKACG